VLRQRLTDDGVAALAEVLADERAEIVTFVSTTFDQRLVEECGKLRAEMRDFKTEIRSDMQTLRAELRTDFRVAIADTRADLLKWSFVFWIGQVAAVVGLASLMS
jgi:hypothetical protein